MKVSVDGTCRGSGKVFTRFTIRDIHEGNIVTMRDCTREHNTVPCSLCEVADHLNQYVVKQYVASFPILDLKEYSFALEEKNPSGKVIDSFTHHVHFTAAKWHSRINYRLNSRLCQEIRDYDETLSYDKATMQIWSCTLDENDLILRGAIYTPYHDDTNLRVDCLDSTLNSVATQLTSCGISKVHPQFTSQINRRELQFSMRIPGGIRRLIFTLIDENHPSHASYTVLDDVMLQDMLNQSTNLYTSAQEDPAYPMWFDSHKPTRGMLTRQRSVCFEKQPLYSIVVPLYNTPTDLFFEMVESVRLQTYPNWELILVNASPQNMELHNNVESVRSQDSRIIVVRLEDNYGISENTNAGIKVASGDFISFFDHDDLIEPDLLFAYTEAINTYDDIDLLYCDEDKLMPNGLLAQPYFKPNLDLELLRSSNYICHMLTIRKNLLDTLPPNTRDFDGAQDHNMTLQAVEKARRVHHVPQVLYHWRICENSTAANADNKPYASEAGIRAIKAHLKRSGINAEVTMSRRPFSYKVSYCIPNDRPLVSILIPTKDQADILDTCLQSILNKSTYDNYEIILIENNSTLPETFEYYKRITGRFREKIRLVSWEHGFNFSKLMNYGAQMAKGDYLLLLNNDTEIITPNWIEIMLGICSQNDVGAVGAKLYYPDNTIQHAGVTVTGTVAGHLGRGLPKSNTGYFDQLDSQRELSAVTAACMMTKRSTFDRVHGFTEELAVAFNDIDFCLKIREINERVIYTPEVELYHYESISRGQDTIDLHKRVRFQREIAYMRYRWAEFYAIGDPYSNPNLSKAEPQNLYCKLG